MKEKRLLQSLSYIDEKYIKEAEPKMTTSTASSGKLITRIACLALVAILGLYLFIPLKNKTNDLTMYESSEYYPLIAAIDGWVYKPKQYKNNFSRIFSNFSFGFGMKMDSASPKDDAYSDPESSQNGYVETTDNQVSGVIEADILKRTETHAFRLITRSDKNELHVYTIDGQSSELVGVLEIQSFANELYHSEPEMYLSLDGKTATVIKSYSEVIDEEKHTNAKVGIISIDVSDPTSPVIKKQVSIDGSYNTSRMVDGNLLLISEFAVRSSAIDYEKPETFVPKITDGQTTKCIEFKDIIYPENITNLRYNVVSLIDEASLDILGANALLCYNSNVYVSNDHVYATLQYTDSGTFDDESNRYSKTASDIVILKYSDGALENKGSITVDGNIKDQYSMDEYEGHFRVVTSTNDYVYNFKDKTYTPLGDKRRSANLTVFNLETLTKVAEIVDFAPENEEAMSVRFDGNTAYVCTAEVVQMTDPVYFFDLSDYSNITYTDTGTIDGFSTSLIQLDEGYLLGIGEENTTNSKVEVYEELDGKVVSVDKYLFQGTYSTAYKSYLIDRESNLFGFAIDRVPVNGKYTSYYVLLVFDGYDLHEEVKIELVGSDYTDASRVRAFIDGDYLYITDDTGIDVVEIFTDIHDAEE